MKKNRGRKANLSLTPQRIFWTFMVFCLFGYLLEGLYWYFEYGYFASRKGLLYGPFSVVYGLAAVLILLVFNPQRRKNIFVLYLLIYIFSVMTEFSISLVQEWIFGYTSWDYGDAPYSLLGRANLLFAVPWAFFGLVLVRWVYPLLCRGFAKLPGKFLRGAALVLFIFMLSNAALSAGAVYRYDQRQDGIPASNFVQVTLDKYYPDIYLEERFARIKKGRT